jgi:hypothetical protein
VKETAEGIADTAGNLVGQAREKVQEWTSAAGETMAQTKDRVQEWASTGAQWTGETARDFGHEATMLIRRYPIPALLAGFAVGFLLARATKS